MKKNEVTVTEYAEHTEDPKSWASPRPSFDMDRFNIELERRCGRINDTPMFRLVWGGERDEYLIDQLEVGVGYDYRVDGKDHFVSAIAHDFEFPDDAVIAPRMETFKIFTPRFVIEEYRTEGFGANMYHKAWAVEEVEVTGKQSGRVNLLSHYRQPSEKDMQMCEYLKRLKETLTPDDIRELRAADRAVEEHRKQHERDEFVGQMSEDTAHALEYGLGPSAKKFGFDPNLRVDIREHTNKLIREHNND